MTAIIIKYRVFCEIFSISTWSFPYQCIILNDITDPQRMTRMYEVGSDIQLLPAQQMSRKNRMYSDN